MKLAIHNMSTNKIFTKYIKHHYT